MAQVRDPVTIVAEKRVPFDNVLPVIGIDYTGASFAMHVRNDYGDTGDPIIEIGDSVSGSEGLSVTYGDYADPVTGETVQASIIRIKINETTIEGIDLAVDEADDLRLVYDIHLTPSGGSKFVLCRGPFIITPGSTI